MNKAVPISQITDAIDARAYQRKAMAMAHVMMIVRQRGDIIPNCFDMQNYDYFVDAGNNMAAVPKGAIAPDEANSRLAEDDSYNEAMSSFGDDMKKMHPDANATWNPKTRKWDENSSKSPTSAEPDKGDEK